MRESLYRLEDYLNHRKEEFIALFEFGTRGGRIVIAPKRKMNGIELQSIYTANVEFTFRDHHPPEDEIVSYIRVFQYWFKDRVPNSDVWVFGTSIFREVSTNALEHIKQRLLEKTGLSLIELDGQTEANLSLLAFIATCQLGTYPLNVVENPKILLIDQGGGSVEMSYFDLLKGELVSQTLLSQFGTVYLQDKLFETTSNSKEIRKCRAGLNAFIDERLQEQKGLQELERNSVGLTVYGLGSALSYFFTVGSNHKNHHTRISVSQMKSKIESCLKDLEKRAERLRNSLDDPKVKQQVVLICGLSAYVKMLEKIGIQRIHFCGYGLKYGILVSLNKYNWKPTSENLRSAEVHVAIKQESLGL